MLLWRATMAASSAYELNEADLESIAVLFNAVKALRGRVPQEEEAALTARFDDTVESVLTELHVALDQTHNAHQRRARIVRAKASLYDLSFELVVHLASTVKAELGMVCQKLRNTVNSHVRALADEVGAAVEEAEARVAAAEAGQARAESEVGQLLQAAQIVEAEAERRIQEAKGGDVQVAAQMTAQMEALRTENKTLAAENASLSLRVHQLESQLASAAVRDQVMMGLPTTTGASPAASPRSPPSSSTSAASGAAEAASSSHSHSHGGSPGGGGGGRSSALARGNSIVSLLTAHSSSSRNTRRTSTVPQSPVDAITGRVKAHASPAKSVQGGSSSPGGATDAGSTSGSATGSASVSQGGNARVLTLKQLKDFIEALYVSKAKHDAKCAECGLPRETVEQHLYTHLGTKFGTFKSIIIEHAGAVIRSANRYAAANVDNDVVVFVKLLRNDVDEEFRAVQAAVKSTAVELLREALRAANPTKSEANISSMLTQRTHTHHGFVQDSEWRQIIKFMYNEADQAVLCEAVRALALKDAVATTLEVSMPDAHMTVAALAANEAEADAAVAAAAASEAQVVAVVSGLSVEDGTTLLSRVNPRIAVGWTPFLKVLLDFQLAGHERFLGKFRRLFRELDRDRTGVLDAEQFQILAQRVSPTSTKSVADMLRLLQAVDPGDNGIITFSQCVAALSADLVAEATAAAAAPALASAAPASEPSPAPAAASVSDIPGGPTAAMLARVSAAISSTIDRIPAVQAAQALASASAAPATTATAAAPAAAAPPPPPPAATNTSSNTAGGGSSAAAAPRVVVSSRVQGRIVMHS